MFDWSLYWNELKRCKECIVSELTDMLNATTVRTVVPLFRRLFAKMERCFNP